jgi:hypothetical protein
MTAVLVTASDCKVFMRVTATADDSLIQSLADSVESLFLVQCGRTARPFATAATGVAEVKNGTSHAMLMMDYPIASISAITIGVDASNPEETLTPTDVNSVVFTTGQRALWRTDGGVWRQRLALQSYSLTDSYGVAAAPTLYPRVVHVTYSHDADAPDLAKLAVKRAVASVYRQIGSEDAKSETLPDGYSRTLADVSSDPIWKMAVESVTEPMV